MRIGTHTLMLEVFPGPFIKVTIDVQPKRGVIEVLTFIKSDSKQIENAINSN